MLRYFESKCHAPIAATEKTVSSCPYANNTTNIMMMIWGDVALVLN